MRVSISALQSRRLLSGIAFLISFFFLFGQFFNCCLINESIGTALNRAFHSSSHEHEVGAQADADADDDEDAHCRGHAGHAHPETIVSSGVEGEATPRFEQVESCLSEQSFSGKPMLASEIAVSHVAISVVHLLAEVPASLPFLFERPRPQNKSSPPLYLTTLRILV
ncbi:MAG TPA: hypothetical protein VJ385_14475 [Fibrobacteria bacterium]|nr:hypothetical protein [Fibrobacteria bacterium]